MFWIYEVVLSLLPRGYRFLHALGGGLARLKYFFCPKDWMRIVRNLRIVSQGRISRVRGFFLGSSVLANFVHYWLDVLYFGAVRGREDLLKAVTLKGEENLPKKPFSRAVIGATAHLGNWEVAGFWLGEMEYPITAIALPHRDKEVDSFFNRVRERHGVKVVPVGHTGRVVGVLKRKEFLAVLGDWDFSGGKGLVEVEFFGKRVLFPSGIGVLSKRFDALVVPMFCVMKGIGKYELTVYPPIESRERSEREVVQAYVKALEGVLDRFPYQWFMFGPIRYAPETVGLSELCVVIPAYNEEQHIGTLLETFSDKGIKVIVIDDGSTDKTSEISSQFEFVTVHRLSCNEGKGVAIKEGLALAKEFGYKWALLMDADGQHLPEEMDRFLAAVKSNVGMVCGNRLHDPTGMPWIRRFTNRLMSFIISAYTLDWIPDTQCGYRLIRLEAIDPQDLTGDRYEIETDLILRVREKGWDIVSVPISSVYHGTAVSYINPVRDTLRFVAFMVQDLVKRIVRRR